MKTLLDEFYTSILDSIQYADGELCVIVTEGIRAAEPNDITIAGHVIKNTYAVDATGESRFVEVRFSMPIVWQVVDETFTSWDDYEERDDSSKLQLLDRSKYLDYVRASHGLFENIRGPGRHYRVWTENEIVDVVACEPPIVGLSAGR